MKTLCLTRFHLRWPASSDIVYNSLIFRGVIIDLKNWSKQYYPIRINELIMFLHLYFQISSNYKRSSQNATLSYFWTRCWPLVERVLESWKQTSWSGGGARILLVQVYCSRQEFNWPQYTHERAGSATIVVVGLETCDVYLSLLQSAGFGLLVWLGISVTEWWNQNARGR